MIKYFIPLLSLICGCAVITGLTETESQPPLALAALLAVANNASGMSTPAGASVSSTTPTSNQVLTGSTTTVVVNFSTAMNTSSVESAFSLSDGSTNLTGTYAWSGLNSVLTFTPTALTAWKVHTVNIASSAKTAEGGSLTAYSFSFRIGPFITTTGTGTLKWMSGGTGIATGTWSEADSFCSGYGMRLATEAEWTAAYSGNQTQLFTPTSGATSRYWTSSPSVVGQHRYVFWNWVDSTWTAGAMGDTNTLYKRCVL